MPRRRSLEKAVSSSPLFLLSPEIRIMIYGLLLTTSEQISFEEHPRRRLSYLRRTRLNNALPDLYPSILTACRLIYQESCPLLYRGNSFYFRAPETSDTFRWVTSSKYAAWVEEIGTTMDKLIRPTHWRRNVKAWRCLAKNTSKFNLPRWIENFGLVGKQRFNFRDNYPHLKRLTIAMGRCLMTASTVDLAVVCELIGASIEHLDSVRIIGLNDETMIEAFERMVEKPRKSPKDRRSVQKHITEDQTRVGWKDVTLWWGFENSTPPYHTPKPEKHPERRRRLFKMGQGPNYDYTCGKSVVPTATPPARPAGFGYVQI